MKGLRKGEKKKRRTVYSRRVRIGRQEDSSSCFLHSLSLSLSFSLCASAFVIFSAEKKRKEKGEKEKNRTAPRHGNSTNNDEFNLF